MAKCQKRLAPHFTGIVTIHILYTVDILTDVHLCELHALGTLHIDTKFGAVGLHICTYIQ